MCNVQSIHINIWPMILDFNRLRHCGQHMFIRWRWVTTNLHGVSNDLDIKQQWFQNLIIANKTHCVMTRYLLSLSAAGHIANDHVQITWFVNHHRSSQCDTHIDPESGWSKQDVCSVMIAGTVLSRDSQIDSLSLSHTHTHAHTHTHTPVCNLRSPKVIHICACICVYWNHIGSCSKLSKWCKATTMRSC